MTQAGRDLAVDLVIANRVLVRHGIIDAFGHVSARSNTDPERFLLARNIAPALVEAEDVMTFAFDGTPLGGDARDPYLERFIHGSIYRARPDVGAVVHSHAASLIPFGVVRKAGLRPVFHMSSFFAPPSPCSRSATRPAPTTTCWCATKRSATRSRPCSATSPPC